MSKAGDSILRGLKQADMAKISEQTADFYARELDRVVQWLAGFKAHGDVGANFPSLATLSIIRAHFVALSDATDDATGLSRTVVSNVGSMFAEAPALTLIKKNQAKTAAAHAGPLTRTPAQRKKMSKIMSASWRKRKAGK